MMSRSLSAQREHVVVENSNSSVILIGKWSVWLFETAQSRGFATGLSQSDVGDDDRPFTLFGIRGLGRRATRPTPDASRSTRPAPSRRDCGRPCLSRPTAFA